MKIKPFYLYPIAGYEKALRLVLDCISQIFALNQCVIQLRLDLFVLVLEPCYKSIDYDNIANIKQYCTNIKTLHG